MSRARSEMFRPADGGRPEHSGRAAPRTLVRNTVRPRNAREKNFFFFKPPPFPLDRRLFIYQNDIYFLIRLFAAVFGRKSREILIRRLSDLRKTNLSLSRSLGPAAASTNAHRVSDETFAARNKKFPWHNVRFTKRCDVSERTRAERSIA